MYICFHDTQKFKIKDASLQTMTIGVLLISVDRVKIKRDRHIMDFGSLVVHLKDDLAIGQEKINGILVGRFENEISFFPIM